MTTAPSRPAELLLGAAAAGADSATLSLPADFGAEKAAWAFVDATLVRWRRTALAPRVHTAAGELVANALEHGLSGPFAEPFPHPLVVAVLSEGPDVLCAVFDPGTGLPLKATGHGLHVVDAVSDAWGWTVPGPWGKGVWAAISASGTGAGPAPHTVRRLLLLTEFLTGDERPRLVTAGREPTVPGLV
ncbi:ATP-binding protein [Streptomyces sp. TRM66268-LWL]|uniref:ATP-binding protein n=1 Tax=Streptomyces polyasparticus TaxID=2767826 RepID=A0ABR7S6H7_9ACTN|nr:ATP-binding protein [Streptomyces polyasparticus]MBC9711033.1 ATP-binding protein [Streptomyces polyasparticus]